MRSKIKSSVKKFRLELKKSASTAIIAAFSFLIALSWREVITAYVSKIEEVSPLKGEMISAIIITIISVAGILIVTKIFSKN